MGRQLLAIRHGLIAFTHRDTEKHPLPVGDAGQNGAGLPGHQAAPVPSPAGQHGIGGNELFTHGLGFGQPVRIFVRVPLINELVKCFFDRGL